MEGHGRSKRVKVGHGWSFPITGLTFQVRKVVGGCGGCVACRIIVSVPVPDPFLWTLDFRLLTWIWDLDLGLGLDNCHAQGFLG